MSRVNLPLLTPFATELKSRFTAMRQKLRQTVRAAGTDTSGVAALEFGLIAPIMFFALIGTVEMSQAITVDRRVTLIASTIADLVAREKTMSPTGAENAMLIMDALIAPYEKTELRITLAHIGAMNGDATRTKVCWSKNHANGGVHSYTNNTNFALPTGLVEAGGGVIVAEVQYNLKPFLFGYFIQAALPLKDTFYLKPRVSNYIAYDGIPRDDARSCLF
jgi:Flp pilus assembly protein TadG